MNQDEKRTTALDAGARLVAPHGGSGTVWREWGQGPVMVLLHGSSGSWTHWLSNIEVLSKTFTVLVPDLPGNGDSPDLGDRTFIDLGQRLLGDMALIAPGKTLTVVGFSFGSLVAEAMALSAPDQINNVVLIRGSFDGKIPSFPAGMKSWKNLAADEAREVHRHNLAVSMIKNPERIDDEAVDLHASNLRLATVRPTDFSNAGLERTLEDITAHLTAIRGEFDALGGDADMQRSALVARRPGTDLHIIKGAGHWVAYENPDAIHSILQQL